MIKKLNKKKLENNTCCEMCCYKNNSINCPRNPRNLKR